MQRRRTSARRLLGRRPRLSFESLEVRSLLSGDALYVPLDPALDQFGDQIMTVQGYGDGSQASFGIFDTGASAITFSPDDASLFEFNGFPIPIKNPGGAAADGIGGSIIGDVSEPGNIVADGIHASTLSFDQDGFPVFGTTLTTAAQTSGLQAFIGTPDGSPDLPTITGTPLLVKSPEHPAGLAALVSMIGESLDFSELVPGLIIPIPDVNFVDPTTTLSTVVGSTDPVSILLTPYGGDNYADPGDLITDSPIQTIEGVSVVTDTSQVDQQNFLFDTGAQLSVISTATAAALGLDLSAPETTITVQGVAGSETVPGFTLKDLVLPRTDGGTIHFTNIPVYVLDVAEGIDGILGMNAFDTADKFLFNPYDPTAPAGHGTLTITYLINPDRTSFPFDPSELNILLGGRNKGFANALNGHSVPIYHPKAASPGTADVSIQVSPSTFTPVVGQRESFVVKVPADASGSVDLYDGEAKIATAKIAGGAATLTSGPLTIGKHNFKVAYSGNAKYATKTTAPQSITVGKASTSVQLRTSTPHAYVGQTFTINAAVSPIAPGAGTPTGNVVFKDGSKTLSTVSLVNGVATLNTKFTPAGKAHRIVATYLGDTNDLGSASPTLETPVDPLPTSTSLSVVAVMVKSGRKNVESEKFTIVVASSLPGVAAPNGGISLMINGKKYSASLSRGVATITIPKVAVLNRTATALFAGNATYGSSRSSSILIGPSAGA